jgi:integrase
MMATLSRGVYQVRDRLVIQWVARGRRYREWLPRGTTPKQAERTRQRKLVEAESGRTPVSGKVTFETLVELLLADYAAKHRKRQPALARLTAAFAGWKAADVDFTALSKYVAARQQEGAADATIHNELAAFGRACTLAVRAGVLAVRPPLPMPTVRNVRECYLTVDELDRLLTLLPEELAAAAEFGALTGWRRGNVFDLTWEHVDFGRGEVRAPAGSTKNGDAIITPFLVRSRLHALLRERHRATGGAGRVFGFDRKSYDAAWAKAVGPAGLDKWGTQYDPRAGAVRKVRPRFHDLRHTFAQHMSDAAVPDNVLLALGGWKTPAMLGRYRVENPAAKRAAVVEREKYHQRERARTRQDRTRVVDLKAAVGGR